MHKECSVKLRDILGLMTIIAMIFFTVPAFATTGKRPVPIADPSAQASADASAGAQSRAGDNSVSVTNGTSGASDHDNFYVLPAPMFAPQLPAINSPCTNSGQEGFSFGWSFLSRYTAQSSTDNCIALEMYNAAVKSCRYATAGQIMDLLTTKTLAGFQAPKRAELIDLTPTECAALTAPPKKAAIVYETISVPKRVKAKATVDQQCLQSASQACKIK